MGLGEEKARWRLAHSESSAHTHRTPPFDFSADQPVALILLAFALFLTLLRLSLAKGQQMGGVRFVQQQRHAKWASRGRSHRIGFQSDRSLRATMEAGERANERRIEVLEDSCCWRRSAWVVNFSERCAALMEACLSLTKVGKVGWHFAPLVILHGLACYSKRRPC